MSCLGRTAISFYYLYPSFSTFCIPQLVFASMQVPSFLTPIWKHQLSFFEFFHFFVVSLGFLNRCFLQGGGFLLKLKECIHVHIISTLAMFLLASSAPFFSVLFCFTINSVAPAAASVVVATTSTVVLLLDQLLGHLFGWLSVSSSFWLLGWLSLLLSSHKYFSSSVVRGSVIILSRSS